MPEAAIYDYIVVGSGAGGGTVAARLAEAGMRVLVLEAGGDPREPEPGSARVPDDYDVPAFHPFASENPAMSWDFYVRHYRDDAQQQRDPKLQPNGILYPRAGTLGGCTAHNAMIFVAPPDHDWNEIAELTGDASWRASNMRRYFRRIENCRHSPGWRLLARLGIDPTGHGWRGWLPTERAMPRQTFGDKALIHTLIELGITTVLRTPRWLAALRRLIVGHADPNNRGVRAQTAEGVCFTPLSTDRHRRFGARERLRAVQAKYPDRLHIELNALVTRIVLDGHNRAVAVEYLKGAHLYKASRSVSPQSGEPCVARAGREIILAGGAFNTPQLLMLSGIGAPEALAKAGIAPRIPLDGVGRNLQDRYEVAIVNRMAQKWVVLRGAQFQLGDALHQEWAGQRSGMYTSNGAAFALARRSRQYLPVPDLFFMALLAPFRGYFPGYAQQMVGRADYLTWTVLKAHTRNRAGTVELRSSDPRDMPLIQFNNFDQMDDPTGTDLRAVVDGIRVARTITAPLVASGLIEEEELPGAKLTSDEALQQFVRDNAWGHHASCTCPIGPANAGGVLDSAFRVHGAQGLRVVDASVFPKIPGFFIACAVYMIAEKAADAILATAREEGAGHG